MLCLRVPTDPAWSRAAARDLDLVLVDHAHCEMKAATNALSLAVRYPGDLGLVRALTTLAQEELEHFHRVVSFLERRGLPLGTPPVDDYAADLRRATRALPATDLSPVVDRLLVGALIEARSCERFKLLLEHLPSSVDEELRDFYRELFECEARHYKTYVDLALAAARALPLAAEDAEAAAIGARVHARLAAIADAEGAIVARLAAGSERAAVHG
jgi:tRNA-(ms[2]io[6]A)-hydroxylase